ncbi:MAG: family 78 glycoside hydrolase catalytic domain [Clostridia bacterium]|nr:family 78 glycoside hydrolase catalytic domain [Clostridia bacterium]
MYQREIKSDFTASWIAAPEELLASFDAARPEEFPNSKFIWGRDYVRQHLGRVFSVKGGVKRAFLHFSCDNIFDVFLNGERVVSEEKNAKREVVLREGENVLWLRTYQTATNERFTSAIIGGIGIEYANGSYGEVVTDEGFCVKRLVDFWVTEEPKGWEDHLGDEREIPLITADRHPIAIKRSCYFRRTFAASREVRRAILYASAQGCYEPYLNGKRVTDAQFMPSCADKAKEYQKFDVTDRIQSGMNVIGAITGNGWYNCAAYGRIFANLPSLMMELVIEYADGTHETVKTDETWEVAPSPLTDNDLQYGERYDARLEIDGWCEAREVDTAWVPAAVVPTPFKSLLCQNYPPVRAVGEHACHPIREITKGVWLYDIGINIAGTVKIKLHHPKRGQRILLQCCERLDENGMPELGAYGAVYFQQDTLPSGKSPWCLRNLNVYTAKGEAYEEYVPRFSYTGFRYVYVSGMENPPAGDELVAIELHNDLCEIGAFSSSDRSLARLWEAVRQTWKNNCFNGPTDCPTREKNFWNGDAQIFSYAACWYTDADAFLGRWADVGRKMQPGPYGWEDEEYAIPWTLYKFFGDCEILRVKYPDMLALIEKRCEFDGMILPQNPHSPYNDWLNPTGQNLSPQFFSGCWHLRMLDIVSRVADVLGDTERRDMLRAQFEVGRAEFNRLHYDAKKAEYDERLQSALVFPLAFGIVPAEDRKRVGDTLCRYIAESNGALTTGFLATRYLLHVLADTGHFDTAIALLHRKEFPSWNYVFDTGATNMTESWLGMKDPDKSLSMSHFSLGSVVTFLFEYLGGIRVEECAAGFTHVVLHPCFDPTLGDCEVRYRTPQGEIRSEWHYENGNPVWSYSIPDGVSFEIIE